MEQRHAGIINRQPKPPGERYDVGGVTLHLAPGVPDVYVDAEVWLDTEIADFDGLCIAAGADRRESLVATAKVLEQLLAKTIELLRAAS